MEQLLTYFKPEHYDLLLNIDKHTKKLQGTVTIKGRSKADVLKLHAVDLSVDNFEINGKKVDFLHENGVISCVVAPGSDLVVKVGYHRTLNENMQGAYLSAYQHQSTGEDKPHKERIVSTQFESHYARECFPCIDEPAAKATFSLSVTVPDQDDIILTNVSGTTTPKMSTYLLAFCVGKFHYVESRTKSGTLVRTYAPLDQPLSSLDFPTKVAVKALDYYEELFGIPYPLDKLDQVAIPDFEAGAMENWGLVTYRMSQLLCSEQSSLAAKKSVALTVTHELSHQWFGNLVTMKWWNDLWLNESFATIMEYYCTDHIFPEYHVWNDFFTQDCLAALYRDAIAGVQSVREDVKDPAEIATLFDPCIVYAKGAHLMLMLIRAMGEKSFFSGIKAYFEKNQYKNADADDLWTALDPYADFDVKAFMTAWITQPGYPVLTDGTQQRFLLSGDTDNTQYPIAEAQDDMSGHYLINLSGPEFASALENFDTLSEEQRLRLLIDRMLLAETPLVASASLVPLIGKFQSETSAPVWNLVDNVISKLTLFIDYDTKEEQKYQNYLYNLVEKPLKKLGLTPKSGESLNDTELRQTLLSVAVYSKNPALINSLCDLYNNNLDSISADIRPFVLFAKMWRDEATFYEEALEKYKTASDPELQSNLRSVLAKPRLPEHIDFAFSLLKGSPLLRPQDHLGFLLRLRRWRYTRDRALDWLLENWDYICKISGEKSVEDYPRYFASTIDRPDDAKRFLDFFLQFSEDPVLARTLQVAKNDIESTLSLISSDKKAVLAAISRLA